VYTFPFLFTNTMHSFAQLAVAALSLLGRSLAAPVPLVVHPGDASDIVITAQDTLNGTLVGGTASGQTNGGLAAAANAQLGLSFVNNFGAESVNVYVTGYDSNNAIVMLQPNGQWYYPPSTTSSAPVQVTGNINIPLGSKGSTTTVTLPDYISSGRVWVAAGELQFFVVDAGGNTGLVEPSAVNPSDPSAGVNWGFVELTNNAGGIYADISYVDFVGMPLGIQLQSSDGSTQSALGLNGDAVSQICSGLKAQAQSDGQPWDELCVTDSSGNPIRVLSPNDYISLSNNAFSDYYTDYVNQVWSFYSSNTLTIDTQGSAGDVSCGVSGGTLSCAGDNRGYAAPSAGDIFGCNSGPFAREQSDNDVHVAVIPRLCAAFDRSTFLLNGGNVQPSLPDSNYYTVAPTNYYSKLVHEQEIDGKGYAFAYDDVNPDGGANAAGVVSSGNPQVLTVIIGGQA
jgi:hypothetical protein